MKRRIEIILANVKVVYFQNLLIDFFSRSRSPDFPTHVLFEANHRPSKIKSYVELHFSNFRIGVAAEKKDEPSQELAKIVIQSYPTHLVVFIEEIEDETEWEKVENLVRKIIVKVQQLDIEIIIVEPIALNPMKVKNEEGELPAGKRMPTRQPGRPSHADDDWAWFQVNVLERQVSDVKSEWKERSGVIARSLLDPDRAFRRATDPNRRPKTVNTGK